VVCGSGLLAAWGIRESVGFSAAMTLVETSGLVAVIAVALLFAPGSPVHDAPAGAIASAAAVDLPAAPRGVLSASLLAFFAFVGFESLVNVAEETHAPHRLLPRAIGLTLAITTVLYVLVGWAVLRVVSPADLAASAAPLSLVVDRALGRGGSIVSLIAAFATLNGVVLLMVMATRVLYGLGAQGHLPAMLSRVHPRTQTPLAATALVTVCALALALGFAVADLAELSSRIVLVVFVLVNLALVRIKRRNEPTPPEAFVVPGWVPLAGAASCALLLLADLI
jgi:amino acid transporter